MIERFTQGSLTWIDLLNPSSAEVREVMEEAGLPPEYVGDLTGPIPRSSAIGAKGILKITFDFPIVKRTDINHPHEVKLLATKTHLVSVRFEDINAFDQYRREFEILSILKSTKKKATGAHLLLALLDFLYESLNTKLDYLESRLADIESEIFNEREKEMVFEISNISRRTITFRHVLKTHERVLQQLEMLTTAYWTKDNLAAVTELQDKYHFLLDRVQTVGETVDELRDTNIAILNTKQNEIMKILTIISFITFPLTLFTSMFGMNTVATPIVGVQYDFWIIVGVMVVVSNGFFWFFKRKRWI